MAEQPKGGFYIAVGLVVACADWLCDLSRPRCDRSHAGCAAWRRCRASEDRPQGRRTTGRVEPGYGEPDDRQGIHVQARREAAAGQGDGRVQAARQQHGAIRSERLGRLGADHVRERRIQGGQGMDGTGRRGIQGRAGADRQPGRDARRLCRRRAFTSAGPRSIWCRCSSRASSTPRATRRDSRIMPRIYQQVDFSNGGDGIVVRENIKTVADLRGKKMVLAQNSPSHYFALNMLVSGGVQPPEVEMNFTEDAFQAAAAFNRRKTSPACVSWAPDIYNLSKIKGNRMLVTTQDANQLIADVWFARADFARDHGPIIEGLVRGIFDAMEKLKEQAAKKKVSELMAAGYNIPAGRRARRCSATPTAPTGPRTSSSSSTRTTRRISSASGSAPTCFIAGSARSATGRCPSTR